MAHHPPWNPPYGPPGIEQETEFEVGPFQGPLEFPYDPNASPSSGPGLTPAPGNVLATGYGEPVFHDYSSGTIECAQFAAPSAFGSAGPASFSAQPDPTPNTLCNPAGPGFPPAPGHLHGYGVPIWTPATHRQPVSNVSSLSGSHPLIATQAATLGQRPPVLRSSPGLRTAFNPTATRPARQAFGTAGNMVPGAPQQLHLQATGRSTPGPGAFIRRQWQHLRGSTPQDANSCWRCRSDHKLCSPGVPCQRCATPRGNSAIPCRRGQVCDATAEIPFLCHLPGGASQLLVEVLPSDLRPAANLLSQARRRQRQTVSRIKRPDNESGCNTHALFCTIVNTEVENIRCFEPNRPFADSVVIKPLVSLPYDDLIADIVWELEDNPEAAQLVGVEAVEDLVGLLEAACLCEVQWGRDDRRRRLVYSSMFCLKHCLEALRLSAHGMLTADAHTHCAEAGECISPAFHGLTRYALRYTEALTTAFFHKDKAKDSNWVLIFYSLCIQAHVRHALTSLEERLRSAELSAAGGMEMEDTYARPLRSASYLHTAVDLFSQISAQSKGKLARQILDSRPKPSVYLQKLSHGSSRAGGGGGGSGWGWQCWREEGVPEFLERIFQIPANDSTLDLYPRRLTELSGSGTDPDYAMTITPAPAPPPPATTVTATVTGATTATPMARAAVAQTQECAGGVSNTEGDGWTISSPPANSTPDIDSIWSGTSHGENDSDATTIYARSLTVSGPPSSYAGSITSSMVEDDPYWLHFQANAQGGSYY